jgi:hypothetical protein
MVCSASPNDVVVATLSSGARRCGNDVVRSGPRTARLGLSSPAGTTIPLSRITWLARWAILASGPAAPPPASNRGPVLANETTRRFRGDVCACVHKRYLEYEILLTV